MKTNSRSWVIGVIIILTLALTSCQVEEVSENQLRIVRYSVRAKDLPDNWKFTGEYWGKYFGGETYTAGYGVGTNNNILRFSHSISIYSDEKQAKDAYPKWVDEEFTATKKWPDAEFTPSDSSDDYKYECLQLFSGKPIVSCSYIQRHKQFISDVLVTFDTDTISFEQINGILKVIDDRLNTVDINDD